MPTNAPTAAAEQDVFWGEIAPTEHVVHLYGDEQAFSELLERFVTGGLLAYESVIVIATPPHLARLNDRLGAKGMNLRAARADDRYFDLDADACLASFMVNGSPDQARFNDVVTKLIARAGRHGRRVRAFGEMVAILWEQGHTGATVQLEHFWNQLRETTPFPLYCSYPTAGFTQDTADSLRAICAAHTKVISNGSGEPWLKVRSA